MGKKIAKRLQALEAKVDSQKVYDVQNGVSVVKSLASAKFDETVEVALRLGVDPITVKDVIHDEKGNAILTLIGKGEKSRRVKITADATQLLDKYITSRKITTKLDTHIFPSQRNAHLSVAAIEEIYEKYTKQAKAEHPELFCHGPYTPHVMRHTTATHLIEAGVPLAIVKNILGHTSIQTTQIYLDISQQTVDRSMKRWNEKWFSKNNPDETVLPQEKDTIPDFLK